MPMRDANHADETAQGKPEGVPGVVFRKARIWKTAAALSVAGFVAVAGLAAVGWHYWTGRTPAGPAPAPAKAEAPAPEPPAPPAVATKQRIIDGVAVPKDA